jgi:hypothetical protein
MVQCLKIMKGKDFQLKTLHSANYQSNVLN